jgi:Ni/Co efflux regulator RcnB
MNTKKQRFVVRFGMLALVAFLALPMTAFAQSNGRGRGKPTDIFVNGHDARDGRWDKNGQRDRDRDRYNDELRRRRAIEEAQRRRGRDWGGYGSYGGSSQLRQTALNAGYNNGTQEGRKDRQRGERFEFRDEGDYSNATEDYNSRYGNRELYRRYFREGFANGYRDGYNGY